MAELAVGHAFEIAERLKEIDRESEVGRDSSDVARRAFVGEQVWLVDLDPVEVRGGDRFKFLGERPAEGDGGYRLFHSRLRRDRGTADRRCSGRAAETLRIGAERGYCLKLGRDALRLATNRPRRRAAAA